MPRIERDSLGEVEVPKDAYFGGFTARARKNFKMSESGTEKALVRAIARIKVAGSKVNRGLGLLDEAKAEAIISAAREVVSGNFDDQFPLDMIQAGAGTPVHMNVNEVIANRATELLGGQKGEYLVHPNDHVNMGQSSNNVVPTALRLALLDLARGLIDELDGLIDALEDKSDEFKDIVKVGRTHYQDAVPITLGQEFGAYAHNVGRVRDLVEDSLSYLREVGVGGNAVGTGINTPPEFRDRLVEELSRVTGEDLQPAEDPIATTQSMLPFANYSGSLRGAAEELVKILDDLVFLSSGPKAGINEISLPEVEPGSSIMPGKVNPSIPEAVKMGLFQVLGYDHSVSLAAKEGHLELNVMTPLIATSLITGTRTFENSVKTLRKMCVEGIKANRNEITRQFDESTAAATALSPYLGYERVAELVKLVLEEDRSLKRTILERDWLTEPELDRLLDPERLTSPGGVDEDLRDEVRKRLDETS